MSGKEEVDEGYRAGLGRLIIVFNLVMEIDCFEVLIYNRIIFIDFSGNF